MRFQTRRAMKSMIAACLLTERGQPVNHTTTNNPVVQLQGTIVAVDPISRELHVQAGSEIREFYVPLGCSIVLNDERVKLRMLQPFDPAIIVYSQEHDTAYALSITVDWDSSLSQSIRQEPAAARAPAGLMECT